METAPNYSRNVTYPFTVTIQWSPRTNGHDITCPQIGYVCPTTGDVTYNWNFSTLGDFLESLPVRFFAKWCGKSGITKHWNICESDGDKKRGYVVRLKFQETTPNCYTIHMQSTWQELTAGLETAEDGFIHPLTGRKLNRPREVTCRYIQYSHPDGFTWSDPLRARKGQRTISDAARKVYKKLVRYNQITDVSIARRIESVLNLENERAFVRRQASRDGGGNVVALLSELEGLRYMRWQLEGRYKQAELEPLGEGRFLQCALWIAPWAVTLLSLESYHWQLDASFRGMAPYVYCIPHLICHNVSLPIGFVMGPTECSSLYDLWYTKMKDYIAMHGAELPGALVLSDGGSWFGKFCRENELPNVLCHRHLLESIGTHSIVCALLKPILDAYTEEMLEAAMLQLDADLKAFARLGKVTPADVEKVSRLTGRVYNGQLDFTGETDDAGALRAKWSLPGRGGIERTNNHSEGFHGKVNRKTAGLRSLSRKMEVIIAMIEKSAKTFIERIEGGAARKRMYELALAAKDMPDVAAEEDCGCWQAHRNAQLFGTQRFCIHTCAGLSRDSCLVQLQHVTPDSLRSGGTPELQIEPAEGPWNGACEEETTQKPAAIPWKNCHVSDGPAVAQLISDVAFLVNMGMAGAGRAVAMSFEYLRISVAEYESASCEFRARVKAKVFELVQEGDDDMQSLAIMRDHIMQLSTRSQDLEKLKSSLGSLLPLGVRVDEVVTLIRTIENGGADLPLATVKAFKSLEKAAIDKLKEMMGAGFFRDGQALAALKSLIQD